MASVLTNQPVPLNGTGAIRVTPVPIYGTGAIKVTPVPINGTGARCVNLLILSGMRMRLPSFRGASVLLPLVLSAFCTALTCC